MRNFDHLSQQERDIVGDPGDYDWEHPITPPPAVRARNQFSMRLDPSLYQQVAELAQARGMNFSDVVREAIIRAVGSTYSTPGQTLSVGGARIILRTDTETTVRTEGPDIQREETFHQFGMDAVSLIA